jgi:hypothetical protein
LSHAQHGAPDKIDGKWYVINQISLQYTHLESVEVREGLVVMGKSAIATSSISLAMASDMNLLD